MAPHPALGLLLALAAASLARGEGSAPVESRDEIPAPAHLVAKQASFTPVPVDIDPLGAVGDVPWTVHYGTLNIRSGPTTTSSVLGQLAGGAQRVGVYCLVAETDEEWLRIQHNGGDAWITCTAINRIHPTNSANIGALTNLPIGGELVNRWWGMPTTYVPSDLVTIPAGYTTQVPGRVYQLRSEAATAAMAMIDASRADGVNMLILSPYRSGTQQKQIYDSTVSSDGLNQRSSAPPGHSEHQLGTTFDIANPATGGFITNTSAQHAWLVEHADEFGFRQSYEADTVDETGYIEEPWHWRYWRVETGEVEAWAVR